MSIYFDMKSSETYTQSERKKNKPPPPRRHCCSCRHQYARLVHESVRRTFQTICNFGMKCASVCLSHTTQEKRQPAYHDLCMVTSRLLQCRAPKPSFVQLMLPLLSLFSSKTIFTSIIYILCSVMWKNNELFFRFRCSLLIWCLLNTHAAPSFDVQSSGDCVDLLANLPLHCLFRFLARSSARLLSAICCFIHCTIVDFIRLLFCTFRANIIYFIDFDIWTTTDINNLLFN